MNETDAILVRVLARTDATFLPLRDLRRPRPGNTALARIDYRTGLGVAWVAGGSAVERSRASRLLADAAATGLVALTGTQSRTSHVTLSEVAESRARALVGLPPLADAVACMRRIADRVAVLSWLAEPALAGTDWGAPKAGEDFMDVEDALLPALTRGWVESNSDIYGRAAYRLTRIGAAALNRKHDGSPDGVTFADNACEEYHQTIKATLMMLAGKERDPSEVGSIPLSCSEMYYDPKEHGRKGGR